MAVFESDGTLHVVRLILNPQSIPQLLTRHAETYPDVDDHERSAAKLVARGFLEADCVDFVVAVCEWGGDARLVTRLVGLPSGWKTSVPRPEAPPEKSRAIAKALRTAYEHARQSDRQIGEAVALLSSSLHGLGQAYASKFVRFLLPDRAVVLDGFIRGRLGYSDDAPGYDAFLEDCRAILAHVQAMGNITRPDGKPLRICDIEAAVFLSIRSAVPTSKAARIAKTEK